MNTDMAQKLRNVTERMAAIMVGRPMVMTFSCDDAQSIIDAAGENFRKLDLNHVCHLAGMMESRMWHLTGSAIVFGADGRMIDGQHRMAACVMSGVPLTTIVLRIANESAAAPFIDTSHKHRTLQQLAANRGFSGASEVAAGVRLYWGWEQGLRNTRLLGGKEKGWNPGVADAQLTRLGRDAELAVPDARGAYPYILESHGVFLHTWVRRNGGSSAKLSSFFRGVHDGAGLQAGDPALTLRNSVGRQIGSLNRPNKMVMLASAISAWNAHARGRSLQRIGGRMSLARQEELPEIVIPS